MKYLVMGTSQRQRIFYSHNNLLFSPVCVADFKDKRLFFCSSEAENSFLCVLSFSPASAVESIKSVPSVCLSVSALTAELSNQGTF